MSEAAGDVTLHFFRAMPADLSSTPPLASALQSLETCFFLVALWRYPHALLACASAIESAIRAKLRLPPEDKTPFSKMLAQIRSRSNELQSFDQSRLDAFRQARNRIVHYGFGAQDDPITVQLLIEVGLPFLNQCCRDLFGFYLDWHDVRPGVCEFHDLTPPEMSRVGLIPEMADQLRIVSTVYHKAKVNTGLDLTYCFRTFGHYLRVIMKDSFSSLAEQSTMDEADSGGTQWEFERRQKELADKHFNYCSWEFDCPVCKGSETLVGEINQGRLDNNEVSIDRTTCANCGLVIPHGCPYLADVLLHDQIDQNRPRILKEFGLC
jgi:hypothetical protein